jgi:hypothetical protein
LQGGIDLSRLLELISLAHQQQISEQYFSIWLSSTHHYGAAMQIVRLCSVLLVHHNTCAESWIEIAEKAS